MEEILSAIIGYLVSFAADGLIANHEKNLAEQLEKKLALSKALASARPLRDELRAACIQLAQHRDRIGISKQEEPLWLLLSDETFQNDLIEWLQAGGITEGNAVKARMLQTMEAVLTKGGASPERIAFLKTSYFDALDKAVFSHPALAHWRHQLSLDYLREQVVVLRKHAEEAAGIYSPEKQINAIDQYCETALAEWDIIDLSNLPADDIDIGIQQLLLRQLYMPLRIEVEPIKPGEDDDAALARLEEQREARRHREAGHIFADKPSRSDHTGSRTPIGERLGASRRLVVLGDPGGGKTTMLRWMATSYLLRHKGDSAFKQIPDTETLPVQPWIPVLIRCRDLGETDLCRCFTDFLTQHLNKTELQPDEADVMRAVILDRIAKGEVLLLVDGLDEITNPQVRMMFCQELERTSARYPDAPIVVTSRIVGYRDMPYRMGSGFEHGVIAELNKEDKDLFARRWVAVTEQHQTAAEKIKRAQELLDALHSSDRIERLTSNPMLLTTLALVKRKVGKLPNRRNKLYAEAVSVLLNWNPRLYQTIDEDEALPQLEYLAYEMCKRGVQRLTDDEVLDLLDKLRTEYPNIRAIRSREPQAFLALLEARSSILIKSGGSWQKNKSQEKPVWEFRHLTFQEYLAARALIDGRYPGRDRTKSLAQQVAPLAGAVEITKRGLIYADPDNNEVEVPESWREALRLLVADCKDDDVDEVLLAILHPQPGEEAMTGKPRAVLAALCLADEPNVSEESAQLVLAAFAVKVEKYDGSINIETSLDRAALEVGVGIWSPLLKKSLIQEFCQRPSDMRWDVGGLWGMVEMACWRKSGTDSRTFFTGLVQRLKSGDRVEIISAALTVMNAAYEGHVEVAEDIAGCLLDLLALEDFPVNNAAAWALGWLSRGTNKPELQPHWIAKATDVDRVVQAFEATSASEIGTFRWLAIVLGLSKDARALPSLLCRLGEASAEARKDIIGALGQSGNEQAVPPLLTKLDDSDSSVRIAVIQALMTLGDIQAVPPLLTKLDDSDSSVRIAVIQALMTLGDIQAVPSLLTKLDDSDPSIRMAVIHALGQLGDKQAVNPLMAGLDNSDADVRINIIEALGQLGDKQAVPPLITKLDDPNEDVRKATIRALGKLGDKQAVSPLLTKLEDSDADVRATAIRALGKLGDKQAVPPLLATLGDSESYVRMDTIRTLGQLGDKQAMNPLILLLENPDDDVCAAAAAALSALGSEQGTSALTDFLNHSSLARREAAVRELIILRNKPNERELLSRDLNGMYPCIDPNTPITKTRIADTARALEITTQEALALYEAIATDFHLSFEKPT